MVVSGLSGLSGLLVVLLVVVVVVVGGGVHHQVVPLVVVLLVVRSVVVLSVVGGQMGRFVVRSVVGGHWGGKSAGGRSVVGLFVLGCHDVIHGGSGDVGADCDRLNSP